ncbi:MAG: TVP38/TMEM64 family protein [Bacillus sp. (in: firmicutes)]
MNVIKKLRESLFSCQALFTILLFLLVAAFLTNNKDLLSAVRQGDIAYVRESVSGDLLEAYLLMLLVMIIQNSFTVIPLIIVITINLALFGFVYGFLWSWFTSVIAAVIIYTLFRYYFRHIVTNKVNKDILKKINENGYGYVFQARIFPFVPTSLINILAGLSSIHIADFVKATVFGNLIYFFVLALIPAGVLSSSVTVTVIGIVVFLLIGFYYWFSKKKTKAADNENASQQE